jgi:hypothetical protein
MVPHPRLTDTSAQISHFSGAEHVGESRGKKVLTVILPDESRYV